MDNKPNNRKTSKLLDITLVVILFLGIITAINAIDYCMFNRSIEQRIETVEASVRLQQLQDSILYK